MSTVSTPIRAANRVHRFTYAIRQVVAEAKKVEATGMAVRYLNIGDPNAFGFLTPPHLIEAAAKAMRDGPNGYTASAGIPRPRAATADFGPAGERLARPRAHHSGHPEASSSRSRRSWTKATTMARASPTYPL
jgi:hypothetical protein